MFRTVFGANPFSFFLASLLEKPSCKVRLFFQNRSRKYRPKITISTLFQTVSHPAFQLLSQTAHVRSHSRKWVHTRPSEKIAHNGLRGEAGAFRMGVLSLSARTARSQTSPGRGSERQTLPLLGLGQVYSRSTQKACGTVMRSCASLFRRRRGPAGLRDLFLLLSKLQLARPALRAFCVCEVGVVSLPSVCSACCQSVPCAGVKTANLPISEVG